MSGKKNEIDPDPGGFLLFIMKLEFRNGWKYYKGLRCRKEALRPLLRSLPAGLADLIIGWKLGQLSLWVNSKKTFSPVSRFHKPGEAFA